MHVCCFLGSLHSSSQASSSRHQVNFRSKGTVDCDVSQWCIILLNRELVKCVQLSPWLLMKTKPRVVSGLAFQVTWHFLHVELTFWSFWATRAAVGWRSFRPNVCFQVWSIVQRKSDLTVCWLVDSVLASLYVSLTHVTVIWEEKTPTERYPLPSWLVGKFWGSFLN